MAVHASSRAALRAGRPLARALVATLLLSASGCDGGLSGTWASADGQGRLEFRDDGTVYLSSYGGTFACRYELDGDHVIVTGPHGTQVLTRRGDQLEAGLGAVFVRQ